MLMCFWGQVNAILDTTYAGTNVSEKNVWVHMIVGLGICTFTGLPAWRANFVLHGSAFIFSLLAFIYYADHKDDNECPCEEGLDISTPGTTFTSLVLYSAMLGYLCFEWEKQERRDFLLTVQLTKENVDVKVQMQMTGWFKGGATEQTSENKAGTVLSANAHINPEDIELIDSLGEGSFGEVLKCNWKDTVVAVKKVSEVGDTMEEGELDRLAKMMKGFGTEAALMAELRHPNVVMFMGVVVSPKFAGLVMEFCPRGSFFSVLHSDKYSLDWTLVLRILLDAARGMNFLHRHSPPILHMDLKSPNLLVDGDWRCKVADFGLSSLKKMKQAQEANDAQDEVAPPPAQTESGELAGRKSPRSSSNVASLQLGGITAGTVVWAAPEVLAGTDVSELSDVYSFGLIIYEVLTRTVPYKSLAQEAVPYVVSQGKRPDDYEPVPSVQDTLKPLVDLMKDCWTQEAKKRPSFAKIMGVLTSCLQGYVGREDWEDAVVLPNAAVVNVKQETPGFSIQEDDLVLGRKIGAGSFATVYEGTYFGTQVAIKKLHMSGIAADTMKAFQSECDIMMEFRHPNIVLFMGSCNKPPSLLLVAELLTNGSLYDIYHANSKPSDNTKHVQFVVRVALDMVRGIAYLHNHTPPVLHRDLKSPNVMLDDKLTAKIGDFGFAKMKDDMKTMSLCGSPLWVAPEVIRAEKYGVSCDIYSFSIIVWEVLAWAEPFAGMPAKDVMAGVARGKLRPTIPDFCPASLADILKRCWDKDANARPSAPRLVELLQSVMTESTEGGTAAAAIPAVTDA